MFSEIAIKVENLSKCYHIYNQPRDRLKQFMLPRLQRMVGQAPQNYFREFWALKNVSFDIKKGETVGIIGRNGSGKSTLLQMICGTLNPTSGGITAHGRIAALLELGSGFNPEFTGRENVYLNASVLGLSREETDARFDEIAVFADIGQFIDQPVKTYSSGMVVRLAFAVAINVNPEILIIDEALSVGDELFQRKCFSRIEAIKKNGATILFVSHSGSAVVELCDRAILLDAGEKLAVGVPKKMVGAYQKLLYAPQEKRDAIRNQIWITTGTWESADFSEKLSPSLENPIEMKNSIETDPEDFHDPNLNPQSTLEYVSHGVLIECPRILKLSGEQVNCLKRGNIYRYAYTVRFDRSATNVHFGMLIKTTSGMELGGAVSAPSAMGSIPYVASATTVNVEFRFSCNLNPGTYFLNAGVVGSQQEGQIYLHRVLDICMFKVLPVKEDTATAIVDFNCAATVQLMNESIQRL